MGKKNSKDHVPSSSKHRHVKGSGRPHGKVFTGHKGRGKDYSGESTADILGVQDRPESAVDIINEDASSQGKYSSHISQQEYSTVQMRAKLKMILRLMFLWQCG